MGLGGLVGGLTGGLLGGGGGGGKSKQTTSTEPWSGAKPYFLDLYKQADQAFKGTQQPNADLTQSWNMARGVAQGAGTGGQQTQDLAMRMLNGDFLSPNSNPYLQGAIDAAIRPMTQNFTANVLPQLGSQAIASGAFGGSRQGVVEALAADQLNRAVGDVTSGMSYNLYNQERQNQLMAPSLLNQSLALQLQPAQILQNIGDQQYAQQWAPIQQWSNILSASPFSTSTQTGSVGSSPLGSIAGLASIGAGLFGQGGAFPNVFGG